MEQLCGILNINKEAGFTSHDVVAKLRKLLNLKRVGHTGTLDPEATGVLVICLGQATRAAQYLEAVSKTYEAELVLGITTATEDWTGEVIASSPVEIEARELEEALAKFRGNIWQVPPMYSAVHYQGQRRHQLARQGKVVAREPREVTIHKLELVSFQKPNLAKLYVECSKGTYIRTLCKDVGAELGTGGHMGKLVRLSAGGFTLQDAFTLEEVEAAAEAGGIQQLIVPLGKALSHWPKLLVSSAQEKLISHGCGLQTDLTGMVRIEAADGRLLALGSCEAGVCRPVRVFC
mgnify:FL=1